MFLQSFLRLVTVRYRSKFKLNVIIIQRVVFHFLLMNPNPKILSASYIPDKTLTWLIFFSYESTHSILQLDILNGKPDVNKPEHVMHSMNEV